MKPSLRVPSMIALCEQWFHRLDLFQVVDANMAALEQSNPNLPPATAKAMLLSRSSQDVMRLVKGEKEEKAQAVADAIVKIAFPAFWMQDR